MQGTDLDDLFAAARNTPVQPGPALLARVLEDAEAHQPRQRDPLPVRLRPAAGPPGIWRRLLGALGGGGAVAGLGSAALAGVWIGFAQPAPVAGPVLLLTGALWSETTTDIVELIPDLDDILPEG
ncbi:dihydroorotate dehydrogenase [Paracoccaceae bacterium Fryx2]|nr:dihydroorotate dehydrogenase [Paracoccaceae bacterium Fryx2]